MLYIFNLTNLSNLIEHTIFITITSFSRSIILIGGAPSKSSEAMLHRVSIAFILVKNELWNLGQLLLQLSLIDRLAVQMRLMHHR